jgi:hypothetical protein
MQGKMGMVPADFRYNCTLKFSKQARHLSADFHRLQTVWNLGSSQSLLSQFLVGSSAENQSANNNDNPVPWADIRQNEIEVKIT